THFGGSSSFCVDVTRCVQCGVAHHLVVRVHDRTRDPSHQPRGKQSGQYQSHGCHYTRTTGIWQTVWMEGVHLRALHSCHIVPNLDAAQLSFTPRFHAVATGDTLRVTVSDNGKVVAEACAPAQDGATLCATLSDPKPWSPESPFLYDVLLEVCDNDGTVIDAVYSYAGLRKVHCEGNQFFLNNTPFYQRLVLDQGFYPDGIWTAPSDADLRRDIELSMAAGFNGARLHQKVFEERFHFWADRLGYVTWGESPSWGCDVNQIEDIRNFLPEWAEIVQRDRNHPSIIAWTPFNETGWVWNAPQHRRAQIDTYRLTKALDPTRPVNDASGYVHAKTDLWTVHHYARPDTLRQALEPDTPERVSRRAEHEVSYEGQPYILDEFGGLKWIPPERRDAAGNAWGYGQDIPDLETFYATLAAELACIRAVPHLRGFCYTQLTDVEQEQNGIYAYDRTPKFDLARIRAIFRA
ncbi:MAG: beta-glucuronidase, partial [Kiritimatiellaeota bacterium]|nr:beta-glucuronidase [Kiritimatiellota bacterium]